MRKSCQCHGSQCRLSDHSIKSYETSEQVYSLSKYLYVSVCFSGRKGNILCQSGIRVNQVLMFMKEHSVFLCAEKPPDRGNIT